MKRSDAPVRERKGRKKSAATQSAHCLVSRKANERLTRFKNTAVNFLKKEEKTKPRPFVVTRGKHTAHPSTNTPKKKKKQKGLCLRLPRLGADDGGDGGLSCVASAASRTGLKGDKRPRHPFGVAPASS